MKNKSTVDSLDIPPSFWSHVSVGTQFQCIVMLFCLFSLLHPTFNYRRSTSIQNTHRGHTSIQTQSRLRLSPRIKSLSPVEFNAFVKNAVLFRSNADLKLDSRCPFYTNAHIKDYRWTNSSLFMSPALEHNDAFWIDMQLQLIHRGFRERILGWTPCVSTWLLCIPLNVILLSNAILIRPRIVAYTDDFNATLPEDTCKHNSSCSFSVVEEDNLFSLFSNHKDRTTQRRRRSLVVYVRYETSMHRTSVRGSDAPYSIMRLRDEQALCVQYHMDSMQYLSDSELCKRNTFSTNNSIRVFCPP